MKQKKRSTARLLTAPRVLPGPHLPEKLPHLVHGLPVQAVVDPATVPTVCDDPRVLQGLEMKREPGLGRLERAGQLADTPLTMREHLHDLEPSLVGERVKPGANLGGGWKGHRGHGEDYINKS